MLVTWLREQHALFWYDAVLDMGVLLLPQEKSENSQK
jgi:hypothetical protein